MLNGDVDVKKNKLNWAWRDSKNIRHSFSRKVSGAGVNSHDNNDLLLIP